MNTYLRKMKKNTKALSPVVASIILIAVTVAVSVVVAAWMGGMTIGLMGNAEQVTVTNAVFDAANNKITITAKNTGAAQVTINSAYIDGVQDTTFASGPIPKGDTASFNVTSAAGFIDGAQYQVKLMTAKGTSIIYTATYAVQ